MWISIRFSEQCSENLKREHSYFSLGVKLCDFSVSSCADYGNVTGIIPTQFS